MLRLQEKKIRLAKESLDAGVSQAEKWDIRKEFLAELKEKGARG